jgi:peptidase M1-like protein
MHTLSRRSTTVTRIGAILVVLLWECPLSSQLPPQDGIQLLLGRLQQALERNDSAAFASLFTDAVPAEQVAQYREETFSADAVRYVLRERERAPLAGGDGNAYRLFVELFVESAGRGRMVSTPFTVRRPPGGGPDTWRIAAAEGSSSVQGLFRLRLDTTKQFTVRDLEITAPDLLLTLKEGTVFLIDSDDGVTGLVLLGRGEMRFAPTPEAERGQLRLFAGRDTLVARFDRAMIRLNPRDYEERIPKGPLSSVPVDPQAARRAREVVERDLPRSFAVDLRAVSSGDWHILPREGDFLAEVGTSDYGALTYSRYVAQSEDISLIRRDRRLIVALYQSPLREQAVGRFYSDEQQRDYDVIDYDIDAAVSPARRFVSARARINIRLRTPLSTLTLRLADSLTVTSVSSLQAGALGFVRLRNQNAFFIRLPGQLPVNAPLTLTVAYSGTVESQALENETLEDKTAAVRDMEAHLLQSSRTLWYPQNLFDDYVTATLRITVPDGYSCVGSGEPVVKDAGEAQRVLQEAAPPGRTFVFRAGRPLRYLAFVVSRLTPVDSRTLSLSTGADAPRVTLAISANPVERPKAREIVGPFEDVVRFYASLMGEVPYPSIALALVEAAVPGGHSPAYFVMLNSPSAQAGLSWRNDPATFQGFPEFFLAHELAHQWWGHAIGWKNYHEQWISEGFAQYFAALYAQHARGDRVFEDMLRQFRSWSLAESGSGPVHLGQRLGQIRGEPRVFRALVYNKGAAVLHMLRRVVGDEAFFEGLRQLYETHKFQAVGTDDLQQTFERTSGQRLGRFFDRWIFGTGIPRVGYRLTVAEREVTVRLEQLGDSIFDLPITISLLQEDGRSRDVVVVMSERQLEYHLPTDGPVRQVRINRDSAALARFEQQ